MTLSKLYLKPTASLSLALLRDILMSLMLCLVASISHAETVNTDLYKMCNHQSVLVADKLRRDANGGFTAQDMRMIRLGAIHACMETSKRMANVTDHIQSDPANEKIAVKNNTEEKQIKNSTNNKSIIDRLLRTKKKKDVSPMQKIHRTGGK